MERMKMKRVIVGLLACVATVAVVELILLAFGVGPIRAVPAGAMGAAVWLWTDLKGDEAT